MKDHKIIEGGLYGMPFAQSFQDMCGRNKTAGEYQAGEKENQEWEPERQDFENGMLWGYSVSIKGHTRQIYILQAYSTVYFNSCTKCVGMMHHHTTDCHPLFLCMVAKTGH